MTDKLNNRLTRRAMITRSGRHIAGFSAAALLMPWWMRSSAGAQGLVPKRIIFLLSQNGVMTQGWNNRGGSGSLQEIGGAFQPLNRHRQRISIINNMRYGQPGGHVGGSLTYLTNHHMVNQNNASTRARGPSLDYVISQHLAARGQRTDHALISATAGPAQWGGGQFISYEGANRPIGAEEVPSRLFNALFSNVDATPPPTEGPSQEARMRMRRSVLDRVMAEYRRLQNRLGPEESARLDEIATSIRETEQATFMEESTVTLPACNPNAATTSISRTRDPQTIPAMLRIVAEALSCGRSLVATVRMSHGTVGNTTHHAWHHGEGGNYIADHNAVTHWQAGHVATLLDLLAQKPAGNGTLLDHTLVVWSNEIGVGGANEHGGRRLPLVLAGGFGGVHQGGKLLEANERTHSTLLVAIAQAYGINIQEFGDMAGCDRGAFGGLFTNIG